MSTVDMRQAFSVAAVVTPHATNPLPIGGPCKGLYVGGTGHVNVRMTVGQNDVLFSAVPAGALLPIEVDRVYASGTTATLIVALG